VVERVVDVPASSAPVAAGDADTVEPSAFWMTTGTGSEEGEGEEEEEDEAFFVAFFALEDALALTRFAALREEGAWNGSRREDERPWVEVSPASVVVSSRCARAGR
jgi:hypothetical protein